MYQLHSNFIIGNTPTISATVHFKYSSSSL